MAVPTGIEPAISCVTGRHVNRYTTGPKYKMEEEEGFEPPRALTPLSVFKTDPFSRTWVFLRIFITNVTYMVAAEGVEPTTSRV